MKKDDPLEAARAKSPQSTSRASSVARQSETDKQAAVAPDAASSIAAAKPKSPPPRPSGPGRAAGQGETDKQAAIAEKSAEEIKAETQPRLDVFVFLFRFVSLLLRFCESLFPVVSNAQEAPEAAAEAERRRCRCAPMPLRARRCRDNCATDKEEKGVANSYLLEGLRTVQAAEDRDGG